MLPTLIVGPVSEDRHLAAAHESGHLAVGRHMGARLNAAYVWRDTGRWAGLYKYGRPGDLDAVGARLMHLAGGAAEAILHGRPHPADAAAFVSSGDARLAGVDNFPALLRRPETEGDLRYCIQALGGPLRHVWQRDAKTLEVTGRVGDFDRLPARMIPSRWKPPSY